MINAPAIKRISSSVAAMASVSLLVGPMASVSPAWGAFGIERFQTSVTANQEGAPAIQAGSHPFAMTTTFTLNHHELANKREVVPDGDAKTVEVNLPAGLIAHPTNTTRCTEAEFEAGEHCPDAAVVGAVTVRINLPGLGPGEKSVPVYNLVPPPGVPALLAFDAVGVGIKVHIVGKVRTGGDYGISGEVSNITQKGSLYGVKLTLWGIPSDESHDTERGRCVEHGGTCPVERTGKPFLTLPGSCTGEGLRATMRADSWQEPENWTSLKESSPAMPAIQGCGRLDFSPSLNLMPAEPAAATADSPSGLGVDLRLPQEEGSTGLAEANLRDAVVRLPAGMAVSPSSANGRGVCTPEEIALNNANVPSCPDSSKVGSAEIVTPLLEQPLRGAVYLAQQVNNPFASLLALYLVAEGQGALIKLAGEVALDPVSGRVTTTFKNNPQLPLSDLKLQFSGGPRAPLITPPTCGTYQTTSWLTPWSGTPPATPSDSFTISSGCGGGFSPSFTAGMTNSQGGGYSPLSVTFSRQDGEQRLGSAQVVAPTGLLGVLKSVAQCAEPQASQGTCGPESLIGHSTVGAGPGPDPVYIGGNVFLTGPYKSAPFGLSIVTRALAGPFDLGNVIVRAAISIDPQTGQITVTSDPLPTILQGIPLDLKTVNVTVDRPGFMFNPTNCSPLVVTGTIASLNGASAGVSSPFQAANCASLPFKPSFTVSTQGKTSKANGASLDVRVAQRPGEANIHKVDVQLPLALPSRLTTLQKACTQAQFEANPAGCPEGSFVGVATAHTSILAAPLTGPAILVSHAAAAFPDLVIVLQGEGIRIDLVGNTDIKKGVTFSRFDTVPDAPISSFDLTLPEGPHSALAAYGNLCAPTKTVTVKKRVHHRLRKVQRVVPAPLLMPTTITGQNGAVVAQSTKIAVTGCPGAKHAKKAKRASKARHRNGKRRP